MLDKKEALWTPLMRKIIHQNGETTETVEKNIIDNSKAIYYEVDSTGKKIEKSLLDPINNGYSLAIQNKTGKYFWIKNNGEEKHSVYRKSSNNKYVFDKSEVEY
jgi:hypothetical protein